MASFGRLQAALAAVTNEVTVAAANLNFDFTLIKCEAPIEFHSLASTLSKRRKDDAEHGSAHITARRLGALFEGIPPATPHLLAAYGNRVSEVAQEAKQSSTPEPENSMFAAHGGIDGTSIWAAATSSPTALHVQLLACMLARVWPASEATSVWVELVKERRREIEEKWNKNEALPYTSLSAATQAPVSRMSLAEWDASVRAWLRTADRVKVKEQDQLMHILGEVNTPINYDLSVYQSVITAWTSALDSMEKLISGMPQAVNQGASLLALSSWHLYPDILVAGSTSAQHRFEDPLILPGGTLTLGLAHPSGTDGHGVFWSLSLAHLNFYGRPVAREARLDFQSRKVTFEQFTQAVFGALAAHWGFHGPGVDFAARFFMSLRNAMQRAAYDDKLSAIVRESCSTTLRNASHWTNIIHKAAAIYLDAKDLSDDLSHKLMVLGGKRASKFLPDESRRRTFFGFDDPAVILGMLRGPDERVAFLRHIISKLPEMDANSGSGIYVIRYFNEVHFSDGTWKYGHACGLATGQIQRNSGMQFDGPTTWCHTRWASSLLLEGREFHDELTKPLSVEMMAYLGSKERAFSLENSYTGVNKVLQTYEFVYGNIQSAAIYVDASYHNGYPRNLLAVPSVEDLIWCLDSNLVDMNRMLEYFNGGWDPLSPQVRTLNALSGAHQIYRVLPTATFSTKALSHPLYSTKWAEYSNTKRAQHNVSEFDLLQNRRKPEFVASLEIALSCVAYFETGLDVNPDALLRVFALAFEDSIYISMQLCCDPSESPDAYELKRVAGNIGKPGLTLLIPTKDPVVPSREETSWRFLSNTQFNGLPEDSFGKTSMHLSFTEYYIPFLQSGQQGQDHQVYFLESVMSVYDAGEWIADVDVQRCLNSQLLVRVKEYKCADKHKQNPFKGVISVENWDDILEPPLGDSVIRANGNWVARLAATLVYIQPRIETEGVLSGRIAVFPSSSCLACEANLGLFSGRFDHVSHFAPSTSSVPTGIRIMVY